MNDTTNQLFAMPMTDPTTDIQSWLESHDLDELLTTFVENDITVDLLPTLSAEELREMGVTSLGLRKKALAAIAAFHSPAPTPVRVHEASKVPERAQPALRIQESISQTKPSSYAPPVFLPVPSLPSLPPPSLAATGHRSAPIPPPTLSSPAKLVPQSPSVPSSPKKVKRKLFSGSFLVVSIGLHLVLGLGAGYWVVQQIAAKRKLQFSSGPPTASPSKRALEHKVSLQKRKNAGGAPAQARRISVQGLASNITLPEMPTMATNATQVVAGRMSGMGGAGFGTGLGFGNGNGMGVGGMGTGMGLTFFGLKTSGERVVFVLDFSQSMQPNQLELVVSEMGKTLKSLPPRTQYQVVLFAGGAKFAGSDWKISSTGFDRIVTRGDDTYRFFSPKKSNFAFDFDGPDQGLPKDKWLEAGSAAVASTMKELEKKETWAGTDWRWGFKTAMNMEPSPKVICFMTDGVGGANVDTILNYNNTKGKAKLNTFLMHTSAGASLMNEIAEKTGGQFTIVKNDGSTIPGSKYFSDQAKYDAELRK